MHLAKGLAVGVLAGYAALNLGRSIVRARRHFSFTDRVVLITGGSRGLGLVLARQLVEQGARVAILSRNSDSIDRAVEELELLAGTDRVIGIPGDVRRDADVDQAVQRIRDRWGVVEVLFNVAGIIDVGPLDAMTMSDFENAMQVNCFGALRTSLAVLPGMRQLGWGRIVNVASLGGKRAVPHMLPYAASKFALVGLSNGLRAELKCENILVTTVSPGLMRTGSPRNATFKGQHRLEYAWFAVGDSLPLISMGAEAADKKIIAACQYGRRGVYISNSLNISTYLQAMFPEFTREILEAINGLLPRANGKGTGSAKGYESESAITQSILTALSRQAAIQNNQVQDAFR